ncbi:MAG TPA: hypothetical protein VMJ35_09495 [Dongiaceae bacterium]|nr:hypothetical protein [Dongiaceae bacterium]
MDTHRHRSAGVTAAATFAILGSVTALLIWGYLLLNVINIRADEQGHRLYEIHTVAFLLIALVPPVLIGSLIRTAVGLFQLKPWARVGAMVWSGFALIGSLWLIAFRPFETFVIPEHFVGPMESIQQLFSIAFVFMLLPVSVWWLFLFRLKSVRAQFAPEEEAGGARGGAECQEGTVSCT